MTLIAAMATVILLKSVQLKKCLKVCLKIHSSKIQNVWTLIKAPHAVGGTLGTPSGVRSHSSQLVTHLVKELSG